MMKDVSLAKLEAELRSILKPVHIGTELGGNDDNWIRAWAADFECSDYIEVGGYYTVSGNPTRIELDQVSA